MFGVILLGVALLAWTFVRAPVAWNFDGFLGMVGGGGELRVISFQATGRNRSGKGFHDINGHLVSNIDNSLSEQLHFVIGGTPVLPSSTTGIPPGATFQIVIPLCDMTKNGPGCFRPVTVNPTLGPRAHRKRRGAHPTTCYPCSKEVTPEQFGPAAAEVFDRIRQLTDNAGATDEHRALNYLAMRYPAIYAKAAEEFGQDCSLTGVEVRSSPLSSARKIVDVTFCYTNRNTDFTEKFFVRVDVSEEFPFLVTKMSPYYDR